MGDKVANKGTKTSGKKAYRKSSAYLKKGPKGSKATKK